MNGNGPSPQSIVTSDLFTTNSSDSGYDLGPKLSMITTQVVETIRTTTTFYTSFTECARGLLVRPRWQRFPARAGLRTLLESRGRPPSSEVAPENGSIAKAPSAVNHLMSTCKFLKIFTWKGKIRGRPLLDGFLSSPSIICQSRVVKIAANAPLLAPCPSAATKSVFTLPSP